MSSGKPPPNNQQTGREKLMDSNWVQDEIAKLDPTLQKLIPKAQGGSLDNVIFLADYRNRALKRTKS